MNTPFNYKHLYYFWIVAKEGSMSAAAQRLNMAVQTISAQVRSLEADLGVLLLKPQGRGLVLTEAGLAALRQAERIFEMGAQLPAQVQAAGLGTTVRLNVGIADGLPKSEVQRLLSPVLGIANLRLVCLEGELPDLLADLALHRLDVVLADHAAPYQPHIKVHNHPLGQVGIGWYARHMHWAHACDDFPACLNRLPVLLPTSHAVVRAQIDHWLHQHDLRPRIVGEFEDSALLETFGASGMGLFPASLAIEAALVQRHGVRKVGVCEGVFEHYVAISNERKVMHPAVQRLLAQAT